MKKFFSIACIYTLLLFSQSPCQAQSKIMDAKIDWSPSGGSYTGQLSVYLTDTIGIAGISVKIGTSPDDSDLYQTSQTINATGHFSSQGSLLNNVLQTSIGTFAYHANYYAYLRIRLDNGQYNEIAIHSSN